MTVESTIVIPIVDSWASAFQVFSSPGGAM
jgi:hypothetical protein